METYKVYKFYLKDKKEPYAFTINKKYKDMFLTQRNKSLFYVRKEEMNEYEYMAFSSKNKEFMLMETPLSTGIDSYEMIVATYQEESKLSFYSDRIDEQMNCIYRRLVQQTNLKDKYIESIEYLTNISYMKTNGDKKDVISTFNTFALFVRLFSNTFKMSENESEEE